MIFLLLHEGGTFTRRLHFVSPMVPIPKCASVGDNFVINILQNEKQYL